MMVMLSSLTTLGLGGPANQFVACEDENDLVAAVRAADSLGQKVLLLGAGSNLVVADDGFPGTVISVRSRGVETTRDGADAILQVESGEAWDDFVAVSVDAGLAGIECLSGIPGSVGATPIQNVGAYDQEVAERILRVRPYDRYTGNIYELASSACGFNYRSSIFKRLPGRWVILSVTFALVRQHMSLPIRHRDLCIHLGVDRGERVPLPVVRKAVLDVRRRKGMLLDPNDADTNSAGSFFTNPLLSESDFESVENRVRWSLGPNVHIPANARADGKLQIHAAWLIEHAGFSRGYGDPRGVAISSKHVLALTNRGNGTTEKLLALAVRIATEVHYRFGIELRPEPELVGVAWPALLIPSQ